MSNTILNLEVGLVLNIEYENLDGDLDIIDFDVVEGTNKDLLLYLDGQDRLIEALKTELEAHLTEVSETLEAVRRDDELVDVEANH